MKTAVAMDSHLPALLFDATARSTMAGLVDVDLAAAHGELNHLSATELADVEMLLTGWGVSALGVAELDAMPRLRAIIHAGGGVGWIAPEAWERGIRVASAADANAVPVAEYSFAMIMLALKDALWISRRYVSEQQIIDRECDYPDIGAYGATVGIVGASRVGTKVLELLKGTDVRALLYDPYCTQERADALEAVLVDDILTLAVSSTVLSLHAPVTASTVGMVSRDVLAAMPDSATLINTARGDLVDQAALVEQLETGRIKAILDVTSPEVLDAGHPLYSLTNVLVTPHLSGSAGNELQRLGVAVAENVRRLVEGQRLIGEVMAADRSRLV